jgi:hypothetical protein
MTIILLFQVESIDKCPQHKKRGIMPQITKNMDRITSQPLII